MDLWPITFTVWAVHQQELEGWAFAFFIIILINKLAIIIVIGILIKRNWESLNQAL